MKFSIESSLHRYKMDDQPSQKQIDLEIKITFLEETVGELNKVVYLQQRSIDRIQNQLNELHEKMEALQDSAGGNLPHVKPPHY